MKRNKILRIRVNDKEFTELLKAREKAKCGYRDLILAGIGKIRLRQKPSDPLLLRKYMVELNKIGTNINQIAKVFNQKVYINDKLFITKHLNQLNIYINEIRNIKKLLIETFL